MLDKKIQFVLCYEPCFLDNVDVCKTYGEAIRKVIEIFIYQGFTIFLKRITDRQVF